MPGEVFPEEIVPLPRRPREDPKFAAGKLAILQYVTVGVFLFLISGFWNLQVRNPEWYSELAERNRIKALPILAPRGKILDRDGRVIVDNHSSFSVVVSRDQLRPESVRLIAAGLHLDAEQLWRRVDGFRERPHYEPIVLKNQLSPGELAFVEAHRSTPGFPEMELIHSQQRLYPRHGLAAHLIGYVGEVSEAELNTLEFARYKPGDVVGKAGVERQYNEVLMGVDGQRQVIVDSRGRVRQVFGLEEAIPGKNLRLTIDLDVQAVAELAMEGRRGAVVALDPRNGEILAMVSRPSFDPNRFAGRIRPDYWKQLVEHPETPLLNRAIQAQLAPGSTFKPFVAIAALDSGVIDEGFTVFCRGGAHFYGRFFKCHVKGGHGAVDLHRAIAQSCDVFFYRVGDRLGIDRIAEYAELFGLGKKTGVDLPHEAAGLVPSTRWKVRTFRQKWYAGETISVAIGQGALTVSPLQLAYAVGGLAMGGVWYTPHVVQGAARPKPVKQIRLEPDQLARVVAGMSAVVNEGGTGTRARLPGVEVCGKTGTAQLASNQALKNSKLAQTLKDNAWFVGFAPCESPEIVVAALFEAGEHGHLAAPIVRDVIKAYLDKKARKEASGLIATTPASHPGAPALP
ncbi:MAG: penicillin-binding protein 2 [Bryobacterales bacterium]|nr:penicillin-binding protein 2 [Bryobacterales bacterium]